MWHESWWASMYTVLVVAATQTSILYPLDSIVTVLEHADAPKVTLT